MKINALRCLTLAAPLFVAACGSNSNVPTEATPLTYANIVVHDPSIMAASNGYYYVVGSHMAGGKTKDFINWEQYGSSVNDQAWFSDIQSQLGYAMDWAHTKTFWAGCHIELKSGPYAGKYMMNYCVCQGSCPQAAIGYAIADSPEGPYEDKGILLYSFGSRTMEDTFSPEIMAKLKAAESGDLDAWVEIEAPDGTVINYNSNFCPNAIDPCTFYAPDGQLWMVYGSYSGGIFVHKLNDDGTICRDNGEDYYGTKIMGGYHTPIEGPFIMYSPETEYYYLFTSYGGLNARGGYNVRVARSKTPDGVFVDQCEYSMMDCKGVPGQTMGRQNKIIEKYGYKLMGNFEFEPYGDETEPSEAYMSPGHNSAYYDAKTGKYYLIFHSRFSGRGERYEVRVHEMFMNEEGWPVVTPHRFSGSIQSKLKNKDIVGEYKFINHGTATTGEITKSSLICLNADGTVTGEVNGTWKYTPSKSHRYATITIGDKTYKGVFNYQYDPAANVNRITFSACCDNETIWGSRAGDLK